MERHWILLNHYRNGKWIAFIGQLGFRVYRAVRVRWCLAQGHLDRRSLGIEPATFLLPGNRSYLLSYGHHKRNHKMNTNVIQIKRKGRGIERVPESDVFCESTLSEERTFRMTAERQPSRDRNPGTLSGKIS